jgi:hypothetical protein
MGGTSVCTKRIMAAAEEISPSFVSACAAIVGAWMPKP